jgi:hypothetical protein
VTDIVKVAMIAGLSAATPPTVASLVAVALGIINRTKITRVAEQTDGVTKALVAVEKKLSFKKGKAVGKAEEKERHDV